MNVKQILEKIQAGSLSKHVNDIVICILILFLFTVYVGAMIWDIYKDITKINTQASKTHPTLIEGQK